ncbi:MAG: hypothetical protein Dasosvirus3_17 [Dasosvirus sp.]|uniref:Uncharacterized protein n=1 Tax=Dasosvirus sp. TaxID=2487764 RepID=A0A3G4ZRC8_9VIRU|nr:MAG: hypothetical protein Dasosvirus3_17 [Dasosvirus sp.]
MEKYEKKLVLHARAKNKYKIDKYLHKMQENGGNTLDESNIIKIIDFIEDRFTVYSFERMIDFNEDSGFSNNYRKFMTHNKKCVNELSSQDLEFISMLIDRIKDEKILQCDEETFVEFDSFAIYFNINKKLVIMNPQ